MGRKKTIRFSFTIREGQYQHWTAGSWRVWVNKEDTYITSKTLGSTWKASLHGDESWRIAMTSEHANSPKPLIDPAIGRNLWEFDPTPFEDGKRVAFCIAPQRSTYYPVKDLPTTDAHIGVRDSWDEITVAYVWMTEPDVTIEDGRIIGEPLTLSSGRKVWVVAGVEPCIQKEDYDVVGAMVEPLIPGEHDVSVPGFLVRGLRWE